ncbi:3'-5' exoribonuclease domain-containing protein [Escherichia coli]
MKWWLKQSMRSATADYDLWVPLDDALLQLREFIDENSVNFLFMSGKRSQLRQHDFCAVHTNGRDPLPVAWRYYNDRDVRTIVELESHRLRCQNGYSISKVSAIMHSDDARYQAKYVSAIWQKLIPSQADLYIPDCRRL